MRSNPNSLGATLLLTIFSIGFPQLTATGAKIDPVPVIFDTDMGNDIDDVFALGLLHALQGRGECGIAAVTVSKDHPLSAPFCDVINRYYQPFQHRTRSIVRSATTIDWRQAF